MQPKGLRTFLKRVPLVRAFVMRLRGIKAALRHQWVTRRCGHAVTGPGKILFHDNRVRLRLSCGPQSAMVLRGNLICDSPLGDVGASRITLGSRAKLIVNGDFHLGANVAIGVSDGAELILGGRKDTSGSGISCASRIMVKKRLTIGSDTIIAWNVFLTDCDWHEIAGSPWVAPTEIGNKVWIAESASVLKGCKIGDGCIIASHALCTERTFPARSLVAGVPGRVVREGVEWCRELPSD
jgi:carbonic anhydrase/acetyltransferase-like protein (isoleucine patch superfamily)